MSASDISRKIEELKREAGAVVLAHNYQPPEIQDIADHLGDSLDLSRLAERLDEPVIVFCGVHFMAETAAILSPHKKVILPEPLAGCPMADMMGAGDLHELKKQNPEAAVVTYVNSTAEVKALTDICCTSANAVKVIDSIPAGRMIVFGPDRFLGGWVASQTGREMILWRGYCPTHQRILPEHIEKMREKHPGAVVMVHPEVHPRTAALADEVLGTGGMIRFAGESAADTFIVGTEAGMVYRLQKACPGKKFVAASPTAICRNMKRTTLEKVLDSLDRLEPVIEVPAPIAEKARTAIRRMVEIV